MFEQDFIDFTMKSNDKFKESVGQHDLEMFIVNHHTVKGNWGHPEVIIGIPIKPGSEQMMALCGLVNSCLTIAMIHPLTQKYIN